MLLYTTWKIGMETIINQRAKTERSKKEARHIGNIHV